jgi:cobalamin biosynthesis protein CobD/CbiB
MIAWFNKQLDWAKSFLSEPDGKASHKRAIGTAVVIVFLISHLRISLATQEVIDIPLQWAFTIWGILGLGIADKYVSFKLKNGNGHTTP